SSGCLPAPRAQSFLNSTPVSTSEDGIEKRIADGWRLGRQGAPASPKDQEAIASPRRLPRIE
ncbi:MAG: hypothetical protein WAM53_06740, partial [Terrimicrobiaceae bacterium]